MNKNKFNWAAMIGYNNCLEPLNRLYGTDLNFCDILIILFIRFGNEAGEKVGLKHLEAFFALNSRRRNAYLISIRCKNLMKCGLISFNRKNRVSVMGWFATIRGLQLIRDYEGLLERYKIQGLPVDVF